MNFKERGITIGDLLLFIIFLLLIFFTSTKLRDKQEQTSFNKSELNTFINFD
tara:strand:- start:428 stop:583 length:156 start_codon:yes stop_codon:yes gene_type:complete